MRNLWILAQAGPADGWADLLATYGPFAPFAALLLWVSNLLWKDSKAKEAEIKRLTDLAMERVIPAVLESTQALQRAAEILQRAHANNDRIDNLQVDMNKLKDELSQLVLVLSMRRDLIGNDPRDRGNG